MSDLVKYARESDLRNDPLVTDMADRIESLEAERDGFEKQSNSIRGNRDWHQARADRAEASLARVKALHTPVGEGAPGAYCDLDGRVWPCPTSRAIEREGDE